MGSWCVSGVKDMSYLFSEKKTFNEDLSGWDVSAVTSMTWMFHGSRAFDGNISSWHVAARLGRTLDFPPKFKISVAAADHKLLSKTQPYHPQPIGEAALPIRRESARLGWSAPQFIPILVFREKIRWKPRVPSCRRRLE